MNHADLRRSIIMGHRRPNERLMVREIAECYGSSVTPIRDVLQMLEQESLVTIKPRAGYFVTHVTLKELRDLLELREILELAAVERAATRFTHEHLAALEQVHAGYSDESDESYDRYTDENRRFHYLIAQAAGNQELAEQLGRLHDRLARFMVLRRAGASQPATHARLIDTLRAHDIAAARQAMLDEITATRDVILERVLQEEGSGWAISTITSRK